MKYIKLFEEFKGNRIKVTKDEKKKLREIARVIIKYCNSSKLTSGIDDKYTILFDLGDMKELIGGKFLGNVKNANQQHIDNDYKILDDYAKKLSDLRGTEIIFDRENVCFITKSGKAMTTINVVSEYPKESNKTDNTAGYQTNKNHVVYVNYKTGDIVNKFSEETKSLDYIATFQAGSVLSKNKMYELIKQIESGKTGGEEQQGGGTADLSGIEITWDGENKEEEKPKPQDDDLPRIQTFFDCKDFPFRFGCRNPKIKEIQRCLGMDAKYQTGNFGPLTLAKLRNQYGTAQISDVSSSGKIDETLYQTIMRNCGSTPPPQPNTGTTTTATGTTTTTTTGATTTTPPKPAEPAGTKEAPKTTQLNREGCKSLFKTIDERDQAQGKTTATSTEKEQLKFCMQQYNFGVGTGVNKMKRRYGLTASGGDRGIR